jgi:OmpA-OmpF porin, OOP family
MNILFLMAASALTAPQARNVAPAFPDPNTSWNRSGTVISHGDHLLLRPGLTKYQIRQIIGSPHFDEFFLSKRWNYVITVFDRSGGNPQKCQLSVIFVNGISKEMIWSKPSCEPMPTSASAAEPNYDTDQLRNAHMSVSPIAGPEIPQPSMTAVGNACRQSSTKPNQLVITFDFGQAELGERARGAIIRFAKEAQDVRQHEFIVIGGTDRVGSEQFNLDLSLRRAENVAKVLRERGKARVTSAGLGENREPVATDGTLDKSRRNAVIHIVTSHAICGGN